MSLYKTALFTTLLMISPSLWAVNNLEESPTLSLQQAETMVLKQNPSLFAAEKHMQALAMIPPQVGTLADPTISFKALNLPVNSFSPTQENMTQMQLAISQKLPYPGKLNLKKAIAKDTAKVAISNRDELRLVLLRNVRIHWWNIAYLDKALFIVRNNQHLLRNLVRISEAKYKTGAGLQQDVLLAQLELSKILEQAFKLTSERRVQVAQLNALLNRDTDTSIQLASPLPDMSRAVSQVERLKKWAKKFHPKLQSLGHQIDAADKRIDLANKDYYPDFKVSAAYGFRQGTNPANNQTRSDMASVMLSMNLPIFTDSKQDKALDQRHAEQAQLEFKWKNTLNQINADIDSAVSELHTSQKQMQLFKLGIIPQSRQTTASMLAGYQVNKVDFLNLVRAQLIEFNHDIQYWKHYTKAGQAYAKLAQAVGKKPSLGENHE
ncbi:MAG: TolC family protein [Mariprofundaceae bacterium]|nr:TolC family protein [Mariprofundaceae bacterium]